MTAKFLGGMLEIDVHRVGALYQQIIDLISDEELIPDSMFDAESYEFQASWTNGAAATSRLLTNSKPTAAGRPRTSAMAGWKPASFVVDRGLFDLALVDEARAFGVDVRQPARLVERRREAGRWRLMIDIEGRVETLETDFLAEAGGRGGALAGRRTGAATLAVFAYWRAARLPETPLVEAGDEAWFWCVPLPNGVFNPLAFVDPKTFRSAGSPLEDRFKSLLARSSLIEDCRDAELAGPVRAVDATPYLSDDLIAADAIRLGDAAVAILPDFFERRPKGDPERACGRGGRRHSSAKARAGRCRHELLSRPLA